jgi:hypothetical protein
MPNVFGCRAVAAAQAGHFDTAVEKKWGPNLQGVLPKYLSVKGLKEGVVECPVARFYFSGE